MQRLLIFTLIFFALQSEAQNPRKMKKEIVRAFIESKKNNGLAGRWYICNDDSSYFKKAAFKVYNHADYLYDPQKCCHFMEWKFYNRSHFRLAISHICQEPGIKHVSGDNYYKVKFRIKDDVLFLIIKDYYGRKKRFLVAQFEEEMLWNKIHTSKVMTLKRTF